MKKPNHAVLVTGSSTGIGRATAEFLASHGFRVFAAARKEKDLNELGAIENVVALKMDVTDESQLQAALALIRNDLERNKISKFSLVNNAGVAMAGPVESVPMKKWRDVFDVNVFGLVRTTQVFLPLVRETKGRVVNLSSVAGLMAAPFMGTYSASKFAVEAISDALRRELSELGVKVVLVEPGPIDTPIWDKSMSSKDQDLASFDQASLKVYENKLARMTALFEKSAEDAAPVSTVTDAIYKALTLSTPRVRYVAGSRGTHIEAKVGRYVPAPLIDRMIVGMLKSDRT